jgi:hypothetical protein
VGLPFLAGAPFVFELRRAARTASRARVSSSSLIFGWGYHVRGAFRQVRQHAAAFVEIEEAGGDVKKMLLVQGAYTLLATVVPLSS